MSEITIWQNVLTVCVLVLSYFGYTYFMGLIKKQEKDFQDKLKEFNKLLLLPNTNYVIYNEELLHCIIQDYKINHLSTVNKIHKLLKSTLKNKPKKIALQNQLQGLRESTIIIDWLVFEAILLQDPYLVKWGVFDLPLHFRLADAIKNHPGLISLILQEYE